MVPTELPPSRVSDPADAPSLNWGVLGGGWIAGRFVDAATRFGNQHVIAIGSRDAERARGFAVEHGIPHRHGSYEDLVADPGVDVVYVSTPHTHHLPHARLALEAGKHVLVEKPIGLNAAQAAELARLAADRGLFCAEAMWTLFLPKFDVLRQLLDAGALGTPQTVLSDHGEWFPATHRITSADLAGGPLLDLGTYNFALTGWVLGEPSEIVARGTPSPHGVNGQASALMSYPGGAEALAHTTIMANTRVEATITGDAGSVFLSGARFRPGPFRVRSADGSVDLRYDEPETGYHGLAYEAAEVARRITAGETATPVRRMADSIATLAVIDEVRRQIGITFPGDHAVPA
jgi:predicted dehydrogenase